MYVINLKFCALVISPEGRRVRVVPGNLVHPHLPFAQTDLVDLWDQALHLHPAWGSDITTTVFITGSHKKEYTSEYLQKDRADPQAPEDRLAPEDPETEWEE